MSQQDTDFSTAFRPNGNGKHEDNEGGKWISQVMRRLEKNEKQVEAISSEMKDIKKAIDAVVTNNTNYATGVNKALEGILGEVASLKARPVLDSRVADLEKILAEAGPKVASVEQRLSSVEQRVAGHDAFVAGLGKNGPALQEDLKAAFGLAGAEGMWDKAKVMGRRPVNLKAVGIGALVVGAGVGGLAWYKKSHGYNVWDRSKHRMTEIMQDSAAQNNITVN